MTKLVTRTFFALLLVFLAQACSRTPDTKDILSISAERASQVDRELENIITKHQINTAAIAVIENGDVVWTGYYGMQSPDVPASADTMFDIASITKTVVAETVLRLSIDGRISLDEPMSEYWVDPDIKDDLRHNQLTPRLVLSHRTGFMNWRFLTEDGKLAFKTDPGTALGYSGEGFQYLARFVEAKLGEPFEELARRYVFEPYNMDGAAMIVRPENFSRIAQTLDKDGQFSGYYCRPEGWCRDPGDFSAAGGMVITLQGYSHFLSQSMRGDGLTKKLKKERNRLLALEDKYNCDIVPEALCPLRVGYGLGWHIFELDKNKTIGHLGSDWSMVTMAYYYEDSRDGLVVFFNAPNQSGIAAMVDTLRLLDPDSPELHGYVSRLKRFSN